MVIVLIHWRIKPDPASVTRFLSWWKETATIPDKTGLVGEFLSEPMPADRFVYKVDDLSPQSTDAPYKAFVNVGIWESEAAFHTQVARNFNDNRPLQPFEAMRRKRTILKPREWRIGGFHLPTEGSCI